MIDIQVVIVITEYIIYSLCRLRRAFRNQNTYFILIFSQVYDHMAALETTCTNLYLTVNTKWQSFQSIKNIILFCKYLGLE